VDLTASQGWERGEPKHVEVLIWCMVAFATTPSATVYRFPAGARAAGWCGFAQWGGEVLHWRALGRSEREASAWSRLSGVEALPCGVRWSGRIQEGEE
jgi:hypothetical protein